MVSQVKSPAWFWGLKALLTGTGPFGSLCCISRTKDPHSGPISCLPDTLLVSEEDLNETCPGTTHLSKSNPATFSHDLRRHLGDVASSYMLMSMFAVIAAIGDPEI